MYEPSKQALLSTIRFPDAFNLTDIKEQQKKDEEKQALMTFKDEFVNFQTNVTQGIITNTRAPYSRTLIIPDCIPNDVAFYIGNELVRRFPGRVEGGILTGSPIGILDVHWTPAPPDMEFLESPFRRLRIRF